MLVLFVLARDLLALRNNNNNNNSDDDRNPPDFQAKLCQLNRFVLLALSHFIFVAIANATVAT